MSCGVNLGRVELITNQNAPQNIISTILEGALGGDSLVLA